MSEESDVRDELALIAARCPPPEPDADEIWARVERVRRGARPRVPSRHVGRSTLRWVAAAGIAALLAGGMLVPSIRAEIDRNIAEPVRSWGLERLADLGIGMGAPGVDVPGGSGPVRGAMPAPVERIEIAPSAVLELEIGQCQARGSLTVRRHEAAGAVLESIGGATRGHMVATVDGIRVDNTAVSSGSYRLLVPAGVRQVWVHIGSRSTLLPMRAADPAGWTLYLQSADGTSDAVGHCRP